MHAIRDSQGNFQENECDITIPLVRQVSEAKKTKIYDELNVQKKIEEQAEKLIELKKQYRGVLKSVKKCEESLCRYFDDARIDSIELEMGILVREKTENGYEWKIEI